MSISSILKVAWVPVVDKRACFARTRGQPLFYNIGGKPKPDESDHDALIREVREETGAALIRPSIKRVWTFVGLGHGQADGQMTVITVFSADHEDTELKPMREIEELAWFRWQDAGKTTKLGRDILRWLFENSLIS